MTVIHRLMHSIALLQLAASQCGGVSGTVFQVDNVHRVSSQSATATLDGGYVVVWLDESSNSVWGTLYDATWAIVKKAEFASASGGTTATEVYVAPLQNDTYIVTWREVAESGESSVVGRLFDWDMVNGDAFEILSRGNISDYSLAKTTTGYGVAWNTVFPRFTRGRSFDFAGNQVSGISVTDQELYGPLAVVGTEEGGMIIAHAENEGTKYIAVYNQNGGWSGSISFAPSSFNPLMSVASLSGGYYAVVWADLDGVYTAVFNLSMYISSTQVVDVDASRDEETRPAIVSLSEGRFVVAWHRRSTPDISARVYQFGDEALEPMGTVFQVNIEDAASGPALSVASSGFYAVWTETDGSVYARSFALGSMNASSTAAGN